MNKNSPKAILVIAALLVGGCAINNPSPAKDGPIANEAVPNVARADDSSPQQTKICKRVERTGSRIKRRICHTEKEWDEIKRQTDEQLKKMQAVGDMKRSAGMGPSTMN